MELELSNSQLNQTHGRIRATWQKGEVHRINEQAKVPEKV